MARFYELWDAITTADKGNAVFRLCIGRLRESGFMGGPNPWFDVVVQVRLISKDATVYRGWNSWSSGFPAHSTDGIVIGNFGSGIVEDGKLPYRLPAPSPIPYGAVIALAVPDVGDPVSWAHQDFAIPTFRYPDKQRLHIDMGSRFPLSRVANWEKYFADKILKTCLKYFGDQEPNPGLYSSWVWRLGWAPAHGRLVIQSQIPPSSGAGTWTSISSEDGQIINGGGPAKDKFGFAYQDYMEGEELYPCETILAMHFPAQTGYTIARYDYEEYGHERLGGSVAFETRACGCGRTPKPEREFVTDPGTCGPLSYTDPEPPGMPIPVSDIGLGYTVDPSTGMSLAGWEAANVANHFLTNFYLCGIREALRAINANLVQGVKALDDARQVLDVRLGEIASHLAALRSLGVDTSKLEKKLEEFIEKVDDLFTVEF